MSARGAACTGTPCVLVGRRRSGSAQPVDVAAADKEEAEGMPEEEVAAHEGDLRHDQLRRRAAQTPLKELRAQG